MATRIRLARFGSKKNPHYRLVVADQRAPRDGRYIEILGHYDPQKGIEQATVKSERLQYWLECGAQPTHTAKRIIQKRLQYKYYVVVGSRN